MDLSKIPTWGWVAGGGVLIVGAVMLTSKRAPSSGNGLNSAFTESLQDLMTAVSNLQGDIQGNKPVTSTGGATSSLMGGIPEGQPLAPNGHLGATSATSGPFATAQQAYLRTLTPTQLSNIISTNAKVTGPSMTPAQQTEFKSQVSSMTKAQLAAAVQANAGG